MPGTNTRAALVDAAEIVFARDGFEGASLREIMRIADANPSAIHYHFGGKEGLLEAVLRRAIGPINVGRLERLAELQAEYTDKPAPLRELLDGFMRSAFEAMQALHERGPGRAALVGRAFAQPSPMSQAIIENEFMPVGAAYFPEFARTLPHLDEEILFWRVRWGVVGTVVTMFGYADEHQDFELSLERLIDFTAAGLEAPMT